MYFFWQINIIRMYRQLQYFEEYQQKVSALVGARRTRLLVNQALVLITVGGNDFVNNYFLVPFSARSRQFAIPDYVKYLIAEYRKHLEVIEFDPFWLPLDFVQVSFHATSHHLTFFVF